MTSKLLANMSIHHFEQLFDQVETTELAICDTDAQIECKDGYPVEEDNEVGQSEEAIHVTEGRPRGKDYQGATQ